MTEPKIHPGTIEFVLVCSGQSTQFELVEGQRYEISAKGIIANGHVQPFPFQIGDSGAVVDLLGSHLKALFQSAGSGLGEPLESESAARLPLQHRTGPELVSIRGIRPFLELSAFTDAGASSSTRPQSIGDSIAVVSGAMSALRSMLVSNNAKMSARCRSCGTEMVAADLPSRLEHLTQKRSDGIAALVYSRTDPELVRGRLRKELSLLEFLELTEQHYLIVDSHLIEVSQLSAKYLELSDTPIDLLSGAPHTVQFVANISPLPLNQERIAAMQLNWNNLSTEDRSLAKLGYLANRSALFTDQIAIAECMRCPKCNEEAPLIRNLPQFGVTSPLICKYCNGSGLSRDESDWIGACKSCAGSSLDQSWSAWRLNGISITSLADLTFLEIVQRLGDQHQGLMKICRVMIDAGFGQFKLWHPFSALSPTERIRFALAQCRIFSVSKTLIAIRGVKSDDAIIEKNGEELLANGNILVFDRSIVKIGHALPNPLGKAVSTSTLSETFDLMHPLFPVGKRMTIQAGECHSISGGPEVGGSAILKVLARAVRAAHPDRVFSRAIQIAPDYKQSAAKQLFIDRTVLGELIRAERSRLPTARRTGLNSLPSEILRLTVHEAVKFFSDAPVVCAIAEALCSVGLGDIHLEENWKSLSLSKQICSQLITKFIELIATEEIKHSKKRIIFLFDEPFRGVEVEETELVMSIVRRTISTSEHAAVFNE